MKKVRKSRTQTNPKSLANLIPFKKGYDPNRNLKGAPNTTSELRKAIRELANGSTTVKDEKGKQGKITLLQNLLLDMLNSANAQDRQNILKAMYPGLLVDETKDLTDKRVIKVTLKKEE